MSDEYTPTTTHIRDNFGMTRWYDMTETDAFAAFDRWLTAHDAEIRAEQIETDAQIAAGGIDRAFDRELGAAWQRGKVASAIRAQLTPRTPTPGPFDDVRDVVDGFSVYKKGDKS